MMSSGSGTEKSSGGLIIKTSDAEGSGASGDGDVSISARSSVSGVGGKAKLNGGLSGLSTVGGIIDEQVTFIPRSEEYHIKDPEHGKCEDKVTCSSSCSNVTPSWQRVHHCYDRMVK